MNLLQNESKDKFVHPTLWSFWFIFSFTFTQWLNYPYSLNLKAWVLNNVIAFQLQGWTTDLLGAHYLFQLGLLFLLRELWNILSGAVNSIWHLDLLRPLLHQEKASLIIFDHDISYLGGLG